MFENLNIDEIITRQKAIRTQSRFILIIVVMAWMITFVPDLLDNSGHQTSFYYIDLDLNVQKLNYEGQIPTQILVTRSENPTPFWTVFHSNGTHIVQFTNGNAQEFDSLYFGDDSYTNYVETGLVPESNGDIWSAGTQTIIHWDRDREIWNVIPDVLPVEYGRPVDLAVNDYMIVVAYEQGQVSILDRENPYETKYQIDINQGKPIHLGQFYTDDIYVFNGTQFWLLNDSDSVMLYENTDLLDATVLTTDYSRIYLQQDQNILRVDPYDTNQTQILISIDTILNQVTVSNNQSISAPLEIYDMVVRESWGVTFFATNHGIITRDFENTFQQLDLPYDEPVYTLYMDRFGYVWATHNNSATLPNIDHDSSLTSLVNPLSIMVIPMILLLLAYWQFKIQPARKMVSRNMASLEKELSRLYPNTSTDIPKVKPGLRLIPSLVVLFIGLNLLNIAVIHQMHLMFSACLLILLINSYRKIWWQTEKYPETRRWLNRKMLFPMLFMVGFIIYGPWLKFGFDMSNSDILRTAMVVLLGGLSQVIFVIIAFRLWSNWLIFRELRQAKALKSADYDAYAKTLEIGLPLYSHGAWFYQIMIFIKLITERVDEAEAMIVKRLQEKQYGHAPWLIANDFARLARLKWNVIYPTIEENKEYDLTALDSDVQQEIMEIERLLVASTSYNWFNNMGLAYILMQANHPPSDIEKLLHNCKRPKSLIRITNKLDCDVRVTYYNMHARLEAMRGDFDKAEHYMALAEKPSKHHIPLSRSKIMFARSDIAEYRGDTDQQIQWLQKIIDTYPNTIHATEAQEKIDALNNRT